MEPTIVVECAHCGNVTQQNQLLSHSCRMLYDQCESDDGESKDIHDGYHWFAYECSTCHGLNLFGAFDMESPPRSLRSRLYPPDSTLIPEPHKLANKDPVPSRVARIYAEVFPLRKRSPNAFVVQIRRALEFICHDKGAEGRDLFHKLQDLVSQGVFPGYLAEMTDLLRRIGNIGAHADENDANIWDAELIDDFFRAVVEYVYISPSKIQRLQQRLDSRNNGD